MRSQQDEPNEDMPETEVEGETTSDVDLTTDKLESASGGSSDTDIRTQSADKQGGDVRA